jgi:hypothetical protein
LIGGDGVVALALLVPGAGLLLLAFILADCAGDEPDDAAHERAGDGASGAGERSGHGTQQDTRGRGDRLGARADDVGRIVEQLLLYLLLVHGCFLGRHLEQEQGQRRIPDIARVS